MRLWSISPEYLDPKGLVALWREALLAQKVLLGQTQGYRSHPQLARFIACPDPVAMIGYYLHEVWKEAGRRGYQFDESKIVKPGPRAQLKARLRVQKGQIEYEWDHLLIKLKSRAPLVYETNKAVVIPRPHPLFAIVPGGIEDWERV